jgi:hypothetical protein
LQRCASQISSILCSRLPVSERLQLKRLRRRRAPKVIGARQGVAMDSLKFHALPFYALWAGHPLWPFQWWPLLREGGLRLFSTPLDTRRCTPMPKVPDGEGRTFLPPSPSPHNDSKAVKNGIQFGLCFPGLAKSNHSMPWGWSSLNWPNDGCP